MTILIRIFEQSDLDEVLQLFYETVHTVNAADYSKEHLDAWAPANLDEKLWLEKLTSHYTLVAEIFDPGQNKEIIIGFGDLDGCNLDHLYVHKKHQREGVAKTLLNALEEVARSNKCKEIITESSITARPFFERNGYQIIALREKEHRGMIFVTYSMQKILKEI